MTFSRRSLFGFAPAAALAVGGALSVRSEAAVVAQAPLPQRGEVRQFPGPWNVSRCNNSHTHTLTFDELPSHHHGIIAQSLPPHVHEIAGTSYAVRTTEPRIFDGRRWVALHSPEGEAIASAIVG